MSSSGVLVNPECQQTFQQMSEGKKIRYILFKIEDKDKKEVTVERAVTNEELGVEHNEYETNSRGAYEAFVRDIKERTNNFADCRYAVFDFKFRSNRSGAGNAEMDKIVFFQICPDGSSIKKKMVYASSASAIKLALDTSKILQVQVSEESEMSHQEMVSKLVGKYSDK